MRRRHPDRLSPELFQTLAEQFTEAVFAGENLDYNEARADGVTRGLLVMQIPTWRRLPGGELRFHVVPGFEPVEPVPALLDGVMGDLDELLDMLRDYDPDDEVVVLIIASGEARTFRMQRGDLVSAA